MPKMYLLPEGLWAALGGYLLERPMKEVEPYVIALRQCQPYEPPPALPADETNGPVA